MQGLFMKQNEIPPHLFRTEYSKIVAVLCKRFRLKHIEIAEDIASDTFLKASENWAINGMPENPAAWLYAVAKNKARDYFRRLSFFETEIKKAIKSDEIDKEPDFEFSNKNISDSQLEMIFAVCNPANTIEAQISLALQILCGFSVEEIANAFLSKPETIKKRLQRARANLRKENFKITSLKETEIRSRLDTVLKTVYLLFNEGYFSKTNNRLIRKDLCSEAIRLGLLLVENSHTNTPETNALLALMYFQSSRNEARTNDRGEPILFDEQDRNLWDQALIEKGNLYLINACKGNEISKYHLEAGIAYWHTTFAEQNKWSHILDLYNRLIVIEYSPVTALNRTFAYARVYGHDKAIVEAEKLKLEGNNYYHGLLGYLYADTNIDAAVFHYEQAIGLTKSKAQKQAMRKAIDRMRKPGEDAKRK